MKEKCIMPQDSRYSTTRFAGSERNEIFGGANRKKSIEDGLVVFLTPEQHRTGKHSFHKAPSEWLWLKELAEKTWCEYYDKTINDFSKRYYRNYL